MKWLSDEIRKLDPKIYVKEFSSQDLMATELRSQIKSGDIVLLKGSRSMRMEKVWDQLK
jgi:UDP-N-acetylmuramyl pentapeptide synthase